MGYVWNTDQFLNIYTKLGVKSTFSDIKCGTMPFL